ncbi:unnamed protein product [Durusdinium trenchii]|uniref:Pentatricopeptide repeat-containing protein n=1 Tax=Durusdinium trenchii TaxID=1381693 RepID=A0ABP0L0R4_9DINO
MAKNAVTLVLETCGRRVQWQRALQVAQVEALDVAQCTTVLNICGRGLQWHIATELFHQLPVRRLRPTVVTYNAMINACSRRWEEAIWWFSALEKRGEERKEERPQPSVISYNSLMTVLGTNSLWVQALSVWQQMMREGLQPSVMTISTLGRHLRGPGALRLLSLCNEADVRPDLILCNTVLENCQRMLRWQQALAVLQEMPWKIGITPDEVSYNTAVNALELSDAWSTAVQLLRQMRCEDLQPSTVTYNSTMGALKKSLLWQRTMSLWQELAEDGHRLSEVTGDIAVTALSCSHRWAAAVALVDSQWLGGASEGPWVLQAWLRHGTHVKHSMREGPYGTCSSSCEVR